MVPIVIHNSGDVQPKGDFLYHPGTVEVEVLPPVDTSGWSATTIDDHVAEVRDMYLTALGQKEEARPQRTARLKPKPKPKAEPKSRAEPKAKAEPRPKRKAKIKSRAKPKAKIKPRQRKKTNDRAAKPAVKDTAAGGARE